MIDKEKQREHSRRSMRKLIARDPEGWRAYCRENQRKYHARKRMREWREAAHKYLDWLDAKEKGDA